MKSKSLPLAGLLIIGTLIGASESTAAITIEKSISDENSTEISQILDIQERTLIGGISDQNAITRTIWSKDISRIAIDDSSISETSLIAIRSIIDDQEILDHQIDADIRQIAA
jgi:hypothetical protein